MELTQELVRRLFTYNDGKLYRLTSVAGYDVGLEAGYIKPDDGYCRVKVKGKQYKRSRLVFLYHHGYLPKVVDHINRVRSDDKIENLRESSYTLNMVNRSVTRDKKDGYPIGVTKHGNKYKSVVNYNGLRYYLGLFETVELAEEANQFARDLIQDKGAEMLQRIQNDKE